MSVSGGSSSRRSRVSLIGTATLLVCSLGLALLAVELIAGKILSRPRPDYNGPSLHRTEPENSLGLRDFDYPEERVPGRFRILVAGDSFTYGAGVRFDDSYPKRLERYLNYFGRGEVQGYEVINLGIPRTSTPQQLRQLRKAVDRYRPDLVVVGYCLNDAEDWEDPEGVMALRRRLGYEEFSAPKGVGGVFFEHSSLVRLVVGRVFNSRSFRGQKEYYRTLYRDDYSGWRRTSDAFAGLSELSGEHGVPVAVMIFPLFSFGLGGDYPFTAIHEKLHQTLLDAGLPFLDLLRSYRGVERLRLEADPYRDPHPSELGHRIAAESLWRFLSSQGLVPMSSKLKELPAEVRVPYPYGGSRRGEDGDR